MTNLHDVQSLLTFPPDITPTCAAELAIAAYKAAKVGEAEAKTPWLDLQQQAKVIVADILTELDLGNLATSAGKAYYPAAGVSIAYDAAALDQLCLADPALRERLWPHRNERPRPGALTIR